MMQNLITESQLSFKRDAGSLPTIAIRVMITQENCYNLLLKVDNLTDGLPVLFDPVNKEQLSPTCLTLIFSSPSAVTFC